MACALQFRNVLLGYIAMKIIDVFKRHLDEKKGLVWFQFDKAGFQYCFNFDGFSDFSDSEIAFESCAFSGNECQILIDEINDRCILEFSSLSSDIDHEYYILGLGYFDNKESTLGLMALNVECESFKDDSKGLRAELMENASFDPRDALERYKSLDIIYCQFS
jgi:hypothetical protein